MPFAAYTIEVLVVLFFPFVWLFERLTSVMAPKEKEPTVTSYDLEVIEKFSSGDCLV